MKKILMSLLGLSLLLPGACTLEKRLDGPSGGEARLTVSTQSLTRGGSKTRAAENVPSVEGEDTINSLYLMFFNSATGRYINYTEVALPGPTEANPDGGTSMNVDLGFTFPENTSKDEAYRILAVANISTDYYIGGTIAEWMAMWEGKTETDVVAKAVWEAPSSMASSRLPMHGRFDKPAGEDQLHVILSRDVARLDVTNTMTDYKLVSVSVWNGYPLTSVWEGGIMDFSENTERIRRHFGVNVAEGATTVRGGIYAFENRIANANPADVAAYHDHVSTCLIIGLQPNGGTATEYFRVNMHDANDAQSLVRNHVYNVVIKGVSGNGKGDEETAYLGESNKLIYYIGDWSEDTNGLVVSDEYSTLSIPTKTVNMGGEGSMAEFSIHTFSTLASPSPLSIRSQTYRPAFVTGGFTEVGGAPIYAHLDGNTLIVETKPLGLDETERSGVIVLSYAGLEIAMNVSQSGSHDNFLIVTEPDGGILPFAAYPGIPSGLISVQASGHWTARLYMSGFSFDAQQAIDPVKMIWTNPAAPGDEDYTFEDGRGENGTLGLIIPDETNSTIDKFRVHTHSYNSENRVREAFVIVELDGLEEQYSAVITLSQNFVKRLYYAPDTIESPTGEDWQSEGGTVTFDGTGNLASGLTNNTAKWYVRSAVEGTLYTRWSALLATAGSSDDRDKFEIVSANWSSAEIMDNIVQVKAKGLNTSGRDYTAKLRVQTDPGTFAEINLVQRSASFNLNPAVLAASIPAAGDETEWIALEVPGIPVSSASNMKWTLGNISYNSNTAPDGRRLVKHNVTIEVQDFVEGVAQGDPEPYVEGAEYPMTSKFRLVFPKLYYPNRDMSIAALVTIKVGGMERTISAQQAPLTPKSLMLHSAVTPTYYGSFWTTENNYISTVLQAAFKGAGFSIIATNDADTWNTPVPETTTLLYSIYNNDGYSWATTNTYRDRSTEHWSMIHGQENGSQNALNNSTSPLVAAGHTPFAYNANVSTYTANSGNTTKVMQYLLMKSPKIYLEGTTTPFWQDGISTYINLSNLGSTAVPITISATGNSTTAFIDIKNRIFWMGETEHWGELSARTAGGNRREFIQNVADFMAKAVGYGSHFTDLLLEEGTDFGDGRKAQPAPWDEYWDDTDNGGTDNRLMPARP